MITYRYAKNISLMMFLLVGAVVCLQAGPSSMSFQGRLIDSDGKPIPGESSVQFKLFPTESGAGELWTSPRQSVEANDAGLFSTSVGPFPNLEIFSENDSLFIEVSVGPVGATSLSSLSPRQQLNSVPFSFQSLYAVEAGTAGVAQSLEGAIVTSDTIVDGEVKSVDIAASAVSSSHIEDASITQFDLGVGSVDSSHVIDESLEAVDLSSDAVTSANIQDGSIQEVDLAVNIIGTPQIKDASLSTGKYQLGSVTTDVLADNGVTTGKLVDDAVTTGKIANSSILGEDIQDGAISLNHVDATTALKFVPSGLIALFAGSCPAVGWTRFAALDGRFPMGSAVPGTDGGSASHDHGISNDGSHNHNAGAVDATLTHSFVDTGFAVPSYLLSDVGGFGLKRRDKHVHHLPNDGVHNHSGNTASSSFLPPYRTMVFCQKD